LSSCYRLRGDGDDVDADVDLAVLLRRGRLESEVGAGGEVGHLLLLLLQGAVQHGGGGDGGGCVNASVPDSGVE